VKKGELTTDDMGDPRQGLFNDLWQQVKNYKHRSFSNAYCHSEPFALLVWGTSPHATCHSEPFALLVWGTSPHATCHSEPLSLLVWGTSPHATCHSERSEESHIAQDRLREESRPFACLFAGSSLRLGGSAQSDKIDNYSHRKLGRLMSQAGVLVDMITGRYSYI